MAKFFRFLRRVLILGIVLTFLAQNYIAYEVLSNSPGFNEGIAQNFWGFAPAVTAFNNTISILYSFVSSGISVISEAFSAIFTLSPDTSYGEGISQFYNTYFWWVKSAIVAISYIALPIIALMVVIFLILRLFSKRTALLFYFRVKEIVTETMWDIPLFSGIRDFFTGLFLIFSNIIGSAGKFLLTFAMLMGRALEKPISKMSLFVSKMHTDFDDTIGKQWEEEQERREKKDAEKHAARIERYKAKHQRRLEWKKIRDKEVDENFN